MTIFRASLPTILVCFLACAESDSPLPVVRDLPIGEIRSVRGTGFGLFSNDILVIRAACFSGEEYDLLVDTRRSGTPSISVDYVGIEDSMVAVEPGSPANMAVRRRLSSYLDRNFIRDRSGAIVARSEAASDVGATLRDAHTIEQILEAVFGQDIAELLGFDGHRLLSCKLLGISDAGRCELIMSDEEIRQIVERIGLVEGRAVDVCDRIEEYDLTWGHYWVKVGGQPQLESLGTVEFDCLSLRYDPTEGRAEIRAAYRTKASEVVD